MLPENFTIPLIPDTRASTSSQFPLKDTSNQEGELCILMYLGSQPGALAESSNFLLKFT